MSTINGIGAAFFGASEPGKDGSFVTTKWVTIVLPIVPLGSYRVLPLSSTRIPLVYSSSTFESQAVRLYWPHVIQMYATYLMAALFFYAADLLSGPKFSHRVSNPFLASFMAVALSIFALRASRFIRQGSAFANLLVLAFVLMFSFIVAGNISANPEATLQYMYFLWGAYVIYSIFRYFSPGNSADKTE